MCDLNDSVSFGVIIGSDEIKSIDDFRNFHRSKSFHKSQTKLREYYKDKVQSFLDKNEIYRLLI